MTPEERGQAESLFRACLPQIWQLLNALIRRSYLTVEHAEDFPSWAQERLMRNDFAVVRTAGARFAESAYLRVVLSNLLIDFRNELMGRWRPSAVAKRLGRDAVLLEQLISRDQIPLRQAIHIMLSREKGLSEKQIRQLARELPVRIRSRDVDLNEAEEHGCAAEGEFAVVRTELWQKLDTALKHALSRLSFEDQVIVRMRFQDGATIPQIARALRVEPKPLYRRIDQLLDLLRESLAREGVDRSDVREALDLGIDLSLEEGR